MKWTTEGAIKDVKRWLHELKCAESFYGLDLEIIDLHEDTKDLMERAEKELVPQVLSETIYRLIKEIENFYDTIPTRFTQEAIIQEEENIRRTRHNRRLIRDDRIEYEDDWGRRMVALGH